MKVRLAKGMKPRGRCLGLLALPMLVGCGSGDGAPSGKQNGKIAYTYVAAGSMGDYTIWIVEPDGSREERPLSPSGEIGGASPDWSPDGTKLAFIRFDGPLNRPWARGLWVVNADGKGPKMLVQEQVSDPAWSPDSLRIAFTGSGGIHVHNPDGRITRLAEAKSGSNPTWSPDGKRLAFEREIVRDMVWVGGEIYTVNADGSEEERLGAGSVPDWSPNGEKILFAVLIPESDESFDTYVMNADGSGRKKLTDGRDPKWSPDGEQIVFTSSPSGWNQIWVMNADGSSPRRVSPADEVCGCLAEPDWQPMASAAR